MKRIMLSIASAAACLLLPQLACAQVSHEYFTVKITGQKQGAFKTEIVGPAGAGANGATFDGIRFSSSVDSPRDPASGLATGKRRFSPIVITKAWGVASANLMTAVANNENLTTVKIEFYKQATGPGAGAGAGKEVAYQTLTLTSANLVSLKRYIDTSESGNPADPRALEDLSLTFQKIELTELPGGATASDSWSASSQ